MRNQKKTYAKPIKTYAESKKCYAFKPYAKSSSAYA